MNTVVEENQRPGTLEWLPPSGGERPGFAQRNPSIEGFASVMSACAGDRVEIRVASMLEQSFEAVLYRSGWCGGLGARLVERFGPHRASPRSEGTCPRSGAWRCDWPSVFDFTIQPDWLSGFYFLKLTAWDGALSYVPLVVTDRRKADVLFQCSDFTWLAYNRWPERGSLYDRDGNFWYVGPGTTVSDARPYSSYCQIVDSALTVGSGEYFLWEYPIAAWLEREGYDVAYVANSVIDHDASHLKRAPVLVSAGHDEYYTLRMYEALLNAVNGGLNVLFLSSNVCCGRVELVCRPETEGHLCLERRDRFGHTCDEELELFPEVAEYPWKSPDERHLVGLRSHFPLTGGGDWVCADPEHWAFEGTGMKAGDAVRGLVGWEWMGDPGGYESLAVLGRGEAVGNRGGGTWSSCLATASRGNFVFSASTCWWGAALSSPPGYELPEKFVRPEGPDPRIQRLTKNLLQRAMASGLSAA